MPKLIGYSTAVRNARLDGITADIGANGLLRLYDGTRPAAGGAATTLLATIGFSATSFPAAAAGAMTANAMIDETNAPATGSATWFRIVRSDGTFVIDGNVGTSGSDLNMSPSTAITAGQTVVIDPPVITEGNAG